MTVVMLELVKHLDNKNIPFEYFEVSNQNCVYFSYRGMEFSINKDKRESNRRVNKLYSMVYKANGYGKVDYCDSIDDVIKIIEKEVALNKKLKWKY